MYGGCATCGKRKRTRGKKVRIIRLGGRGMTRRTVVTRTRPDGSSVTRERGYSRSLGNQQDVYN